MASVIGKDRKLNKRKSSFELVDASLSKSRKQSSSDVSCSSVSESETNSSRSNTLLSDSEGSNLGLKSFINDRKLLLQQIFIFLSSDEINAIVPASLQELDTDELQDIFIDVLYSMSNKKLAAVIDDVDLCECNDTDEASDTLKPEETHTFKPHAEIAKADSTTSDYISRIINHYELNVTPEKSIISSHISQRMLDYDLEDGELRSDSNSDG